MARHRRALPALAAAGILLVGCGGDEQPDRYTLAATRACFDEAGIEASTADLDFVATTALGGAMTATVEGNRVVISFGESPADAVRTVRAYRTFAGRRIPLRDLLFQERNTVLLWEEAPTVEQARAVGDCLDG